MNAHEQNAQAREESYHEVSLRAVELLARAQRAADEAVAEAQSYARDLEQSAREQYKQILERAQVAAQQVASAGGSASSVGPGGAREAGADAGAVDAQQLAYVRTYARVAHAQLKSVLAALNDELDQLAAMAEGSNGSDRMPGLLEPSRVPEPSTAAEPSTAPEPSTASGPAVGSSTRTGWEGPMGLPVIADAHQRPSDNDQPPHDGSASERTRLTDDGSWPPIFAATNAISYLYRGPS